MYFPNKKNMKNKRTVDPKEVLWMQRNLSMNFLGHFTVIPPAELKRGIKAILENEQFIKVRK